MNEGMNVVTKLLNQFMLKIIPFALISIFISIEQNAHAQVKQLANSTNVPVHPRILMLKEEEALIRKQIQNDSAWRIVHQVIINECDKMLLKPLVEYKLEGKRLLNKSRECRKRTFYLSYAWRLTGEKKYFDHAEKELLNVCAFKDWNPSHFLDVAEMTMAVALGYDWLYSDLASNSRILIKDAIVRKGLEPSLTSENNWWLAEGSNWNQVCNAGMVSGALAVFDEQTELSKKIINRAIESIQIPMKEDYDPDGAFAEGYGYWTYGTTFNVYLISMLEKAFGTDFGLSGKPGFHKTPQYLLNMIGPTTLNFNYSDCEAKSIINPAMFWFAAKQKDTSLLYSEKLLMKKRDMIFGRDLPALILWASVLNVKDIKEPKQLIWSGQGKNPVALIRTSWKQDGIFVGLKGGSASVSHAHMDVGSFVMDAMGERWAMDFGPQEYNSLESQGVDLWSRKQESQRWQVFRYNNFSHNTLSFDNNLQLVKGTAPIKSTTENPNFLSAITDLTSVYKNNVSKALRGVAIIDKKYVIVKDELALLNDATKVRWTMLTAADVKITGRNTAELSQRGKKLLIEVLEPADVVLKTWSTQPPHEYDEPNPGTTLIGFENEFKAKNLTLSVVLIPQTGSRQNAKKVPPLSEWK